MAKSILDESNILAIATRLQRLSERLRQEGSMVYKANGIDFEPKWFPVIYTLYHKPLLSVVELATEIGYTHPSTISLLKELEKEKLICSKKDTHDDRKRLVELSEKGAALVKQMQPVWVVISSAIEALIDTPNNLMKAISEVEEQLQAKTFLDRTKML